MSYQGISTGTTPNDGTGDSLLTGAVKINSNFGELYNALGDGSNLNVSEIIQDTIGSAINSGTQTGINVNYDDTNNSINFSVSGGTNLLDDEILSFGTDSDLEIFHSSGRNYIDINSGDLSIRDQTSEKFRFVRTTGEFRASAFVSPTLTYPGRVFQLDGYGGTGVDLGVFRQQNPSYSHVNFAIQNKRSATFAYSNFWCMSGDGVRVDADIEFGVRGDGYISSDAGNTIGTPADYAEMFEWEDGNPNKEDRRGFSVVLVGNKIRKASQHDSDNIIGVVSGNPAIVADSAWNHWSEKYLKDDFNCYIYEEHKVIEWIDENGELVSYEDWNIPDGIIIPENAEYKTHDSKGNVLSHRKLNPDFNPEYQYIGREDRPEWDAVGLVGKLRLHKGQPIAPRWIKMRDISDFVEEWLIR